MPRRAAAAARSVSVVSLNAAADEVRAESDPLTAESAAAAPEADADFAVGTTVVTNDAVSLWTAASQTEVVTELVAGALLTVTGPGEQVQGVVWVPVVTPDGALAGYVAADFLTPA
ncbi:MAG: hypothetical protein M3R02_30625 [Chloroflexota bacterium]|nr:hypothetical protein [Chloroflexota bacterium]